MALQRIEITCYGEFCRWGNPVVLPPVEGPEPGARVVDIPGILNFRVDLSGVVSTSYVTRNDAFMNSRLK